MATFAMASSSSVSDNDSINQDMVFIRDVLPEAAILTLTPEIISFALLRTAYTRVQVRVIYKDGYPNKTPIVELTSKVLPVPLLKNKEKECEALAGKHRGEPQLEHIFNFMYDFIQDNMFLPCWKEVKKVAAMCEGTDHKLGCDDKKGVLQLRLRNGLYRQSIDITVPPMYPEECVVVDFPAGNLPSSIMHVFKSHAEDIARRCMAGFTPEAALDALHDTDSAGRNQRTAAEKAAAAREKVVLTNSSLKSLQHDVKVLKKFADLREANTGKDKRNQFTLYSTLERKEFRKNLRRLAKSEKTADIEAEEKRLMQLEQEEMVTLMGKKPNGIAQPSLLAVATYLIQHYFDKLPQEPCQACKECVFPKDPKNADLCNPKSDMRPMRTYCGHWLHHKCLDMWLTTPPFIHKCPVCDRRIWHPDWPEDHKRLEKAYNAQQAKLREMSDVSDFLDMSDDFRR